MLAKWIVAPSARELQFFLQGLRRRGLSFEKKDQTFHITKSQVKARVLGVGPALFSQKMTQWQSAFEPLSSVEVLLIGGAGALPSEDLDQQAEIGSIGRVHRVLNKKGECLYDTGELSSTDPIESLPFESLPFQSLPCESQPIKFPFFETQSRGSLQVLPAYDVLSVESPVTSTTQALKLKAQTGAHIVSMESRAFWSHIASQRVLHQCPQLKGMELRGITDSCDNCEETFYKNLPTVMDILAQWVMDSGFLKLDT